ncbi:hypothetical protein Q3G72_016956 [Acer saccharum]|nr:hypothetical protein Q3G72_016956 [Acer saccharum]
MSTTLKLNHFFVFLFLFFIILLANSEIAKAQICELMTNIPCSILNGEMCNEFCWSELRAASGLCVSDILGPQCLCIIDCD